MNNNELLKFRKEFYKKFEKYINDNKSLSIDEYENILKETIANLKISNETSKKIMIYVGTYAKEKMLSSTREYFTYEDNVKAAYKLFVDLETADTYKVLKENLKKFEAEYDIIYPKVKINNIQVYNNKVEEIKLNYFKNLLYTNEEESYKLIYKSENK